MTAKIAVFGPQKVFVECTRNDQLALDELYAHYRKDDYEGYIRGKYTEPDDLNFYLKNEISQSHRGPTLSSRYPIP